MLQPFLQRSVHVFPGWIEISEIEHNDRSIPLEISFGGVVDRRPAVLPSANIESDAEVCGDAFEDATKRVLLEPDLYESVL